MKRGERRAGPGPVSKKAWSGGRGVAGRALGCMQRMHSYAAAVIQGQRRGVCQRGSLKPGGWGHARHIGAPCCACCQEIEEGRAIEKGRHRLQDWGAGWPDLRTAQNWSGGCGKAWGWRDGWHTVGAAKAGWVKNRRGERNRAARRNERGGRVRLRCEVSHRIETALKRGRGWRRLGAAALPLHAPARHESSWGAHLGGWWVRPGGRREPLLVGWVEHEKKVQSLGRAGAPARAAHPYDRRGEKGGRGGGVGVMAGVRGRGGRRCGDEQPVSRMGWRNGG